MSDKTRIEQPTLLPETSDLATRCAAIGHPGATYNPWMDQTWCACGAVIRPGDHHQHVTCCGGPLDPRTYPGDQP